MVLSSKRLEQGWLHFSPQIASIEPLQQALVQYGHLPARYCRPSPKCRPRCKPIPKRAALPLSKPSEEMFNQVICGIVTCIEHGSHPAVSLKDVYPSPLCSENDAYSSTEFECVYPSRNDITYCPGGSNDQGPFTCVYNKVGHERACSACYRAPGASPARPLHSLPASSMARGLQTQTIKDREVHIAHLRSQDRLPDARDDTASTIRPPMRSLERPSTDLADCVWRTVGWTQSTGAQMAKLTTLRRSRSRHPKLFGAKKP